MENESTAVATKKEKNSNKKGIVKMENESTVVETKKERKNEVAKFVSTLDVDCFSAEIKDKLIRLGLTRKLSIALIGKEFPDEARDFALAELKAGKWNERKPAAEKAMAITKKNLQEKLSTLSADEAEAASAFFKRLGIVL
jgi:hypothetical protein